MSTTRPDSHARDSGGMPEFATGPRAVRDSRLPKGIFPQSGANADSLMNRVVLLVALIGFGSLPIRGLAAPHTAQQMLIDKSHCESAYPDNPRSMLTWCAKAMDDLKYAISVSKSKTASDRFTMAYLLMRQSRAWALWKTGHLAQAQEETCLIQRAAHDLGGSSKDPDTVHYAAGLALGFEGPDLAGMPRQCPS